MTEPLPPPIPEEPGEPRPATPPDAASPWAKATMWMVIVFLVIAAALYIFQSLRDLPGDVVEKTGSLIDKAGETVRGLAQAFNQNSVTTSFLSYATTLHASQHLQFAKLKQTEIFSQKDEATTGFGYIPLPEVIIEARAPVEYTYFVDLNAKWEFVLKESTIYVLAPRIQFNKPAVDVSEIQYEVRKGSIFRNTDAATENLKKSISFMAEQKARANVPLVRETARRQLSEFVENWLRKSFADGTNYPVKVYFPGERLPDNLTIIERPSD